MNITSRTRKAIRRAALLAAMGMGFGAAFAHASAQEPDHGTWKKFQSKYFEQPIVYRPGVFPPLEAEGWVLPFMKDYGDFFEGKVVLEIGTGSGIVSMYAAKLGAKKVVATDIDKSAVQSASTNARRLGFSSVIDPRLVPPTDMSAFSVVGDEEQFDIIISNPPYALDLDAPKNTAVTDTGDLGFSIVRGFEDHVRPGGMAMLYYGSLFYHGVMVKFARYSGYEVRNSLPRALVPWEAKTLFNYYLTRFLEHQKIDTDAFEFTTLELKNIRVQTEPIALIPGRRQSKPHRGWMIIRRKGGE